MNSALQRRVKTACKVHVSIPGLDPAVRDRLHDALHTADRKLGVIVGTRGESTEFVLLTGEPTPAAARFYAEALLAEAASLAELEDEELEAAQITGIVSREFDITGTPRTVEAPAGNYRIVDLGKRGQLRALHEGPLGEWVVYLAGSESRAWAGRALLSVLSELFELPWGKKEPWVYELIEMLAGHKTSLGVRYACPCCDNLTLTDPPPGTYAICPVCWWEDDNTQFCDLDYRGGANQVSLREARTNVQRYGMSERRYVDLARPPLEAERP